MKRGLLLVVGVFNILIVLGQSTQDTLKGNVTYKTSQNVYVKFQSAKALAIGDTLFIDDQGQFQPVLIVHQVSSTSCVGSPINNTVVNLSDALFAIEKNATIPEAGNQQETPTEPVIRIPTQEVTESPIKSSSHISEKTIPAFRGRISAASYVNFANAPGYDVQRMRYTLTLNSRDPKEKGFSVETYMSFRHTINEWQEVRDNILQALKIYTLNVQYKADRNLRLSVGRKINNYISNLGAIDGLQAEKQWNHIVIGTFFGSRPNNLNYGINFNLMQYGGYVTYINQTNKGQQLSTVAFAEQQNHHVTDRRFLYFQHQNSTIKNITLFGSAEIDLYTVKDSKPQGTFNLSSIYVSARYRASRKLSLFGSYDARKNIIYYETYKSFIDQLLEDEMRQGLRCSFNYHPFKKVTVGGSAGYRFEKNQPSPARNFNSYITISQLSPLHISATLSAVLLQTSYLKGDIYGIRVSKDFIKGKLHEEVEYRTVLYHYGSTDFPVRQQIIGLNTAIRLSKKLSLSINYEGEIQTDKTFSRIYSNIVYRL